MASSSSRLGQQALSDSAEKGKFYDREPVTANNGEFMERRWEREREGKKMRETGGKYTQVFLLVACHTFFVKRIEAVSRKLSQVILF
jgi:hypothetical protein